MRITFVATLLIATLVSACDQAPDRSAETASMPYQDALYATESVFGQSSILTLQRLRSGDRPGAEEHLEQVLLGSVLLAGGALSAEDGDGVTLSPRVQDHLRCFLGRVAEAGPELFLYATPDMESRAFIEELGTTSACCNGAPDTPCASSQR